MTYYPYAFFDLNYRFAIRVVSVSGLPMPDVLLRYTHLYLAFGLGRSFDPSHQQWTVFRAGLERVEAPVAWIFDTYIRMTGGLRPPAPQPAFGPFSYAVWEGGRVRLHLWGGAHGESPLARTALMQRLADLGALLKHVRQHIHDAQTMVGGSWLYNIEAYRRLFPPAFLATAMAEEPEPQFIALWGQFLDHNRQLKPEVARRFIDNINDADSLDSLLHAFPHPVLRLECPIQVFYEYAPYNQPSKHGALHEKA